MTHQTRSDGTSEPEILAGGERASVRGADQTSATRVAVPAIAATVLGGIVTAVIAAIIYLAWTGGEFGTGFWVAIAGGVFIGMTVGGLVAGRLAINEREVSGQAYRNIGQTRPRGGTPTGHRGH